ncbi:hypothetical protein L3Y34_012799 [Caenorhabditis briggsae]|uniref:Uncharacterized protein n=1 Tax=Caenorhabditis briggsae TaxID=6238 RepID=A0AAE8ZZY5_CAEBR|nr:hypothetical protein L3Y34_012799 [Caenorhabditis briggsae]
MARRTNIYSQLCLVCTSDKECFQLETRCAKRSTKNSFGVHWPNSWKLSEFTETSMNNYVCCSRNSSAVQSTDTSGNQEKATASNKEDLALAEQEASPSNDSPRMMTRYRKRLSDTATLAIDIKHNRRSMSSNSQPEAVSRQQLVTSLGTPDFFTNGLQYFGMTK